MFGETSFTGEMMLNGGSSGGGGGGDRDLYDQNAFYYDEDTANNADSSARMTSGEEVLYELLFGNSSSTSTTTTASTAKQQNMSQVLAYLQELNSHHIDRLQTEPVILADAQQHIQDEIQSLAFTNYKTFIRTAQCSRDIYADFSQIESRLDQLLGLLPDFASVCDAFPRSIQLLSASRRANTLTLHKHNQLLELLEISQLMDTCVRNEYYDEALELAAYMRRLEKKYATSIGLVHRLCQDVNASLRLMLKQLLQQLKTGGIQFNQCLKIIGLIRRLDVFTDAELRIKFLQLRDIWLQSLLQAIPHADPYQHIAKTIEEMRIHLFDIIIQYRAIFVDDDVAATSTSTTSATTTGSGSSASTTAATKEHNDSKLFYCWLQQKIKHFLGVLRKDLQLGVANRLDSVISQAMYFGLAFSRVGLDFRALMVPIFEEAICKHFADALHTANGKFDEALAKCNWSELYVENHPTTTTTSTTSVKAQPAAAAASAAFSAHPSAPNAATVVNPPMQLLNYPPLAVYLNGVLQGFNELRLCAPLSLHQTMSNELRRSLATMARSIHSFHVKERAAFDSRETETFAQFVRELATTLVPFVESSLRTLFSLEQLKRAYGVTDSHDIDKLSASMHLDVYVLFECLGDMLPPKKQPLTFELPDDVALIAEVESAAAAASASAPALEAADAAADANSTEQTNEPLDQPIQEEIEEEEQKKAEAEDAATTEHAETTSATNAIGDDADEASQTHASDGQKDLDKEESAD